MTNSKFLSLTELLKEADVSASLNVGRIAPSFFYDLTYSFAIFSCIIRYIGKTNAEGVIVVNARLLRFFHFCTLRPQVIEALEEFRNRRGSSSVLELSDLHLLPHGFFSDQASFDTLQYLLSTGSLRQIGNTSVGLSPDPKNILNVLNETIQKEHLLQSEQNLISHLRDMKLKLNELGLS